MDHRVSLKRNREPITLTVREACGASGVGRTTMFEWMKRGEVEFVRLGTKRLIIYASLKRYVLSLPRGG